MLIYNLFKGSQIMRHDISFSHQLILQQAEKRLRITVDNEVAAKLSVNDQLFLHDQQDEYRVIKATVSAINILPEGSEIVLSNPDDNYYVDGHMHLEYGDLSVEYALKFIKEGIRK